MDSCETSVVHAAGVTDAKVHAAGVTDARPGTDGIQEPSPWSNELNPFFAVGAERCNIERIAEADLTTERFFAEFWHKKPVVLLRTAHASERARHATTKRELLRTHGDKVVTLSSLESYPFTHERRQRLRTFLAAMDNATADAYAKDLRFHFRSDLGVSDVYTRPKYADAVVRNDPRNFRLAHQLALGGEGSGLGFHWHNDVFAETLHGRRRWFVYPPTHSPTGGYNPRKTSANWLRDVYPTLNRTSDADDAAGEEQLRECTVDTLEAIYVPDHWFHATLSIGEGASFTVFVDARAPRWATASRPLHAHMEASRWAECAEVAQQQVTGALGANFVPWAYLGLCRYKQRRASDAERALSRCVELNPLFAPCHLWLARSLAALGGSLFSPSAERAAEHSRRAAQLSWAGDDDVCLVGCNQDELPDWRNR